MLSSFQFLARTALALLVLNVARLSVRADDTLRIALFKTASEDASLQSLAAAIDPVLLSEINRVPKLQIAARPALDLPSMQLAIDCVGETAQCLSLAAKQAEAEGLVAPMVRRIGAEIVVTLLLHDVRKRMAITAATRRYSGGNFEDQALDGLPAMVRELFGLAAPVAAAEAAPPVKLPAASEEPESSSETAPPIAAKPSSLVLPIVLGSAGVAFIAAGVVLGMVSQSGEDAYAKMAVKDPTTAGRALDKYDSAATQATLANIAFGVGAASLAAGIVVFIVQANGDTGQDVANTAGTRLALGPGQLTLLGAWN
jgi:hypothetical protein